MSFRVRILLATLAILVVTVGALMIAADQWLRHDLQQRVVAELSRETRLAAAEIPHALWEIPSAADRIAALVGHRISIIDSTGNTLGDSDFDEASLRLLANQLDEPEIRMARDSGVGASVRYNASAKHDEYEVAIKAWPGFVRISSSASEVSDIVGGAQRVVFLAALAALLIGAGLATVMGRAIARPLRELSATARALAAGNPPHYPASSAPEIRQLVRAFRAMDAELATRIAALRRGREETGTLIDSMVEGVMSTDAQGNVAVCNRALRRLFGFGVDEAIPNARELFHNAEARDVVDQVLAGRAILGRELVFDDRTVLATARPLPIGGAVICMHDVSDLRRLEAIRRDFVANVSHELKTPLTSITGYAETLLADTPDPATQRKFLEVIAQNARRMQHLVDDLLDLAKIESGGWTPVVRELDVGEAARAAWQPFAERAESRGVTFRVAESDGKRVYADADALGQIFTNLFDNALRHTPPGGTIDVEARRVDAGTQIVVRDNGSGIPAEHLARVFERFYRVDPARSRDQGGTGLGLSIVRHLVDGHGGRIDLESALGRGTTFRITFPTPTATG